MSVIDNYKGEEVSGSAHLIISDEDGESKAGDVIMRVLEKLKENGSPSLPPNGRPATLVELFKIRDLIDKEILACAIREGGCATKTKNPRQVEHYLFCQLEREFSGVFQSSWKGRVVSLKHIGMSVLLIQGCSNALKLLTKALVIRFKLHECRNVTFFQEGIYVDGVKRENIDQAFLQQVVIPEGIHICIDQQLHELVKYPYSELPHEIIVKICSYLTPHEQVTAGAILPFLREVSKFWKSVRFKKEIPVAQLHALLCANGLSIKELNLSLLRFLHNMKDKKDVLKKLSFYCPNLEALSFKADYTDVDFLPDEAAALAEGFSRFSCLKSLNLSNCHMGGAHVKTIAGNKVTNVVYQDLLPKLHSLTALTSLDLSQNHLDTTSAIVAICEQVSQITTLTSLNLNSNALSADRLDLLAKESGKAIAKAIQSCSQLSELSLADLYWSNEGAMVELVGGFDTLSNLTKLDLGGNYMGSDGVSILAKVLPFLSNLISLNLQWNEIGCMGIFVFADHIHYVSQLQELNLCNNPIGLLGFQKLSTKWTDLSSLTLLNLRDTSLTDYTWYSDDSDDSDEEVDADAIFQDALKSLVTLQSLKSLDLSYNYFDVRLIVDLLSSFHNLEELGFSGMTTWSEELIQAFIQEVSQHPSLKRLKIKNITFNAHTLAAFQELKEKHDNITIETGSE